MVSSGVWMPITHKGKEYGSIYRSTDNVIQVKKNHVEEAEGFSKKQQYFCNKLLNLLRHGSAQQHST
jgi:hypothetical protein